MVAVVVLADWVVVEQVVVLQLVQQVQTVLVVAVVVLQQVQYLRLPVVAVLLSSPIPELAQLQQAAQSVLRHAPVMLYIRS